jgi:hypothetical protein
MHRGKPSRGSRQPMETRKTAALAEAAPARSKAVASESKSLTTDDFVAAAIGEPSTDAVPPPPTAVFASGVSHPDGDDTLPMNAAVHTASVPLAQPVRKPAAKRLVVGAPGADAEVATMGPDPAPIVPGDMPLSSRLDALNHPSHEELAEAAVVPVVLPGLYRNGRLLVPAPLKGTHEILVHQNTMADSEGLERIQDDRDLARLRAQGLLVDFPESASLRMNAALAYDRRCARVWTVRFAVDIARAFYARFQTPLQINSAVRTVAFQVRLQRVNGNAAGIGGDVASPHLTGQALDFGKRGMSMAEIAWMRAYLKPMMDAEKVDVEEEFQQACFHISVYRSYLPAVRKRVTEVAQLR